MSKALKNKVKLNDIVSVKDFGAVGNGSTDDKVALKAALESGFVVDGQGLTYAVSGTLAPTSIKGLRNCTLVQVGDNTATNMSVLELVGLSNFYIENVEINMGSNVTTLFADDGNNGLKIWGANSGGVTTYISNFQVHNVRVTGNGCGTGIHIRHANNFSISMCYVYGRIAGASPDPTNDSQNGFQINNCYDFTMSDCRVDNLQTRLLGVDSRKWTRGILTAEIRECVISNCSVSRVDQGFDFSGAYSASLGYIGSRNWTLSGSTATDCFTYGFKFANVCRDGLVTGCHAVNTGNIGFVFSPSATALPGGLEKYNTQNIDVVGCRVTNTLGNGWAGSNSQGFRIMSNGTYTSYPRGIRLKACAVVDTQDTPTTVQAFSSDATIPEYPTADYNKSIANEVSDYTIGSSVTTGFNGPIGPNITKVTGSSVQSVANNTWTTVDWNTDLIDPLNQHSTVSNNSTVFIKEPGYYEITLQGRFATNGTGDRRSRLLVDGGVLDRTTMIEQPLSGTAASVFNSIVVYVNAGGGITCQVYQSSGGALDFQTNESVFTVKKV